MSRYTIKGNTDFLNSFITNVSNNNYTVADDQSQLLSWLSPLDPGLRHWDIQERRVNTVGEWLIQTKEFRRWCGSSGEGDADRAVLFCYGDPGVGKTFISSLVVDRLCGQAAGQSTSVTCFYFDFAAQKGQSAASILGSLLKQIVSGMERVPEEIWRALREQKKTVGGRRLQVEGAVKMLQLITSSQNTFICVDTLDECAGAQRARFLDSMSEILAKSPGTRIFVTGRPHILAEAERRLVGRVISLSVGPTREDIITYLRARLRDDETPDAMDVSLGQDILEKIPENASEMFLLASLNIEAILEEPTIHRRREQLSKMTGGLGLGDAYCTTIERIKAQGGGKSRLGIAALMWVSHAERHLTADELCYALAVELCSKDLNTGNIPSILTVLSCCRGLISLDKEASVVRLIHFTLKEYLSTQNHIFRRSHAIMAEICLTYLNSKQIKAFSHPSPSSRDTTFLEYCSLYWGVHAKKELSGQAKSLALELFQENGGPGHLPTQFLVDRALDLDKRYFGDYFPVDGLHCASFFGIVEAVAALIEMGHSDHDGGDFWGYTPLSWAAFNGHDEVVKLLLGQEVIDPDKPGNGSQTPLWRAACSGHEEVVKLLLGREEVNPDKPEDNGSTPLSYSAAFGHEGVVRMLLGREDVNPNKPDDYGRRPLSNAARGGHEGVVGILLGREDVDPDKPDNYGRAPLTYAALEGHEGVVRMLLGREDVNPDKPGSYGRIPLTYAALEGHEGVVRILLGRDEVIPDKPDDHGRTPLLCAISEGHGRVVRILLQRDDVNPDKPDNHGTTPLSLAAELGHDDVVKILLSREEVDPENLDNDGDTPLSCAALGGCEGVVRILLEQEGINPDRPNHTGQTPLSIAARKGHKEVIKILLGREEVNPNMVDNDGQTPLQHAAKHGHHQVVELLQHHER